MLKIKTKAAALLAAAVLLAGCSQGAASASSPASAETTPAPTATAAPTATPAPAETPAPAQLDGEALTQALDGLLSWGPGTAGSSLKCVAAAVDLMNWAGANQPQNAPEELSALLADWKAGLDEQALANAQETWPEVSAQAEDLLTMPQLAKDLCEDAGVTLDGTCGEEPLMALADALNAVLGEGASA